MAFLLSTVNRNARAIPGPALAELISGTEAFLAWPYAATESAFTAAAAKRLTSAT